MNRFSPARDLTASHAAVSPGMPHKLLALCGHKTLRAGAEFRGRLLLRCAECAKENRK